MGVLQFDGTDDKAVASTLTAGLSNVPTSAWTVAFAFKRRSATTFDALGYLLSGTPPGTSQCGLSVRDTDDFQIDIAYGTPSDSAYASVSDTAEEYILIASRPAGAAQGIIYSHYLRSTDTLSNQAATGSVGNGIAATMLALCAWQNGDFGHLHLAVAGWWNIELTAAQKLELTANWQTSDWWNCSGGQPQALIEGNSATLVDLAGNATSWVLTGATVDGAETFDAWNFNGTGAIPQIIRPDADTTTTGWTTTPLFSKINDESDATVITATAS